MRVLAALAGGLIGGMIGYLVGAIVGCDWLYPTSNQCGIYGTFFTGSPGFLAVAMAGWLAARSSRDDLR